jgi:hypothetical protein
LFGGPIVVVISPFLRVRLIFNDVTGVKMDIGNAYRTGLLPNAEGN